MGLSIASLAAMPKKTVPLAHSRMLCKSILDFKLSCDPQKNAVVSVHPSMRVSSS